MTLEKSPILEETDRSQLANILQISSRVKTRSLRITLCEQIGIDSDGLDYLEDISPENFALRLVTDLNKRQDFEAIIRLCYVIKHSDKDQRLNDLNIILNKIAYAYLKIDIIPNFNFNSQFLIRCYDLIVLIWKKKLKLIKVSVTKATQQKVDLKSILIASVSMTTLVIGVRFLGLLISPEFMFYDFFMKFQISEKPDENILVVEISDDNLNKWDEEKIYDNRLEKLLKNLQYFKPKLIGIDILRDVPASNDAQYAKDHHANLIKYLKESPSKNNVFTICLYGDEKTKKREGAFAPSPDLISKDPKSNQVGFNNAPVDKIVGDTFRRQLLTMYNDNSKDAGCITDHSFSYLLATRYLEMQRIKIEHSYSSGEKLMNTSFPPKDYRLGSREPGDQGIRGQKNTPLILHRKINNSEYKIVFYPLSELDGSYQGSMLLKKLGLIDVDMNGYQILINYRKADFKRKNAEDITKLANDKNSKLRDLIHNRIVLIGYTGERDGTYVTPVDPKMPGVIIHAHMVSQIINAALEDRPLLQPLPFILEVGLVFTCSLVGGILSRPTKVSIGILFLNVVCYVAFIGGTWLPVVPFILVLLVTPIMAKQIPRLFQSSIPSEA